MRVALRAVIIRISSSRSVNQTTNNLPDCEQPIANSLCSPMKCDGSSKNIANGSANTVGSRVFSYLILLSEDSIRISSATILRVYAAGFVVGCEGEDAHLVLDDLGTVETCRICIKHASAVRSVINARKTRNHAFVQKWNRTHREQPLLDANQ